MQITRPRPGKWRPQTRRLAFVLAPLPVILSLLVVVAQPVSAYHYNPNRMFQNLGNDLCIDIPHNQVYNGQRVVQYHCNWTQAQQFWLVHEGSRSFGTPSQTYNVYSIRPKANTNYCVDVEGGSYSNQAKLLLWDCHGGDNQLWSLWYAGEGSRGPTYTIEAEHSWKCLDVPGGSHQLELQLQQYTCNYTPAQRFYTYNF